MLTDLSTVSEAPASRALDETDGAHGTADSRFPPGLRVTDDGRLAAAKSLLDRHLEKLEDLIVAAEHDRDWAKYLSPGRPELEEPAQWRERVVKPPSAGGYEGVHYVDAARAEAVSPKLITLARKQFDRDQRYGLPLDEAQRMSDSQTSDSSKRPKIGA